MSLSEAPMDVMKKIVRNTSQLLKLTAFTLGAPFVAFALYDHEAEEIRWCDAYGSLQDRFRAITIRDGVGIAGKVVRFKVPIILQSSSEDSLYYPIMRTEQLKTAMAVPIGRDGHVYGVLLAGRRQEGWEPEQEDKDFLRFIADQIDQLSGGLESPSGSGTTESGLLRESALISFLHATMRVHPQVIKLDLLDQAISQMKVGLQEELVKLLRKVLQGLLEHESQEISITLERSEHNQYSLHIVGDRRVDKVWSDKWKSVLSLKQAGCLIVSTGKEGAFQLRILIPTRHLAHAASLEEVIEC